MKFQNLISLLGLFLGACATQNKNLFSQELTPANKPLKSQEWRVSGISSGAMMSGQLGLAHSQQVKGVGLFSGSIYGCSQGNMQTALQVCMKAPEKVSVDDSLKYIKSKAKNNEIDSLEHLQKQNVFILHGKADPVVKVAAVEKNINLYAQLKVPLTKKILDPLAHGFATANKGGDCSATKPPWLNNCAYNTVEELFKINYSSKVPSSFPLVDLKELTQKNLFFFDLSQLINKELLAEAYFNKELYIYRPESCVHESCPAHLALHGCHQAPEFVNQEFIQNAGYIEAAEKYKVVIFFPSVYKSSQNPHGCWDWWGYTNNKYDTKEGVQVKVLKKIMDSF